MIPRFLISTARILCVGFFACAALAQNSWGQTDLTGTWLGNDGATYYLRQVGQMVWWAGMHNEPPDGGHAFFSGLAFTNVFQGRLTGNQIIGQWADVPRGSNLQSGNLTLQVISPNEIHKVSASGGFGGTSWSKVVIGLPPSLNIHDTFNQVKKNGGDTLLDNLKPYKDFAVIIGTVRSPLSLNYPANAGRSFTQFFCEFADQDGDINFDLGVDRSNLEAQANFWTDGWQNGIRASDVRAKLDRLDNKMHSELIMYGRSGAEKSLLGPCRASPTQTLLPGWMEPQPNSVLWNGSSIGGFILGPPNSITVGGASLGVGARVRVTGVIALDCGHGITSPCHEDEPSEDNLEIHPVYSVDVFQAFANPRQGADLTGVWAANDSGTYYVRQVQNTVWWFALSRDQGKAFANVFRGTLQGNSITGEWTDVPLGAFRNNGTLTLAVPQGPLSITLSRTLVTGGFGAQKWDKIFDRTVSTGPIP